MSAQICLNFQPQTYIELDSAGSLLKPRMDRHHKTSTGSTAPVICKSSFVIDESAAMAYNEVKLDAGITLSLQQDKLVIIGIYLYDLRSVELR